MWQGLLGYWLLYTSNMKASGPMASTAEQVTYDGEREAGTISEVGRTGPGK
jgi:hypothetical protein